MILHFSLQLFSENGKNLSRKTPCDRLVSNVFSTRTLSTFPCCGCLGISSSWMCGADCWPVSESGVENILASYSSSESPRPWWFFVASSRKRIRQIPFFLRGLNPGNISANIGSRRPRPDTRMEYFGYSKPLRKNGICQTLYPTADSLRLHIYLLTLIFSAGNGYLKNIFLWLWCWVTG